MALLLRYWGTFTHVGYFADEGLHVPSALSYAKSGVVSNEDWTHPPLGHLTLYGSIKIFGDNAYGWRLHNVLLGTLTVVFMFLVARELFPDTGIPYIAALLLAVDPFHIMYSRTTFMEIPVSCYFLMFLFFVLAYLRTGRDFLIPAGVCLGLTIATKSYYPLAIILVYILAAWQLLKQGEKHALHWAYLFAALVLIPGTIYLLSYLPWFGNGHLFSEFLTMKQDALTTLQSYSGDSFSKVSDLSKLGGKWEWFIKPSSNGFQFFNDGSWGQFILEINSPPIRMLTLPALLMMLWLSYRNWNLQLIIAPSIFITIYVLFQLVRRPMFSYSAVALLPFAYLMIAFCIDFLIARFSNPKLLFNTTIASIIIWGLYLFPLVSAQRVPIKLYKPVLSITSYRSLSEYAVKPENVNQ